MFHLTDDVRRGIIKRQLSYRIQFHMHMLPAVQHILSYCTNEITEVSYLIQSKRNGRSSTFQRSFFSLSSPTCFFFYETSPTCLKVVAMCSHIFVSESFCHVLICALCCEKSCIILNLHTERKKLKFFIPFF